MTRQIRCKWYHHTYISCAVSLFIVTLCSLNVILFPISSSNGFNQLCWMAIMDYEWLKKVSERTKIFKISHLIQLISPFLDTRFLIYLIFDITPICWLLCDIISVWYLISLTSVIVYISFCSLISPPYDIDI